MIRGKRLSESSSESRTIQGRLDGVLENMLSFVSDVKNIPSKSESWNRSKYLHRVGTYKSATWFAKPTWMSPILCSRYGWINITEDMLQCVGCQSLLFGRLPVSFDPIVNEACRKRLEDQICKTAHHACCVWIGNPTPLSVIGIDGGGETGREAARNRFVKRVTGLIKLGGDLPVVDSSFMSLSSGDLSSVLKFLEPFHSSLLDTSPSQEVLESASLLALCGWEPGDSLSAASPQVRCEMCCRSSGLWNFVTHNSQSNDNTDLAIEINDNFENHSEISPGKISVEKPVFRAAEISSEVTVQNDDELLEAVDEGNSAASDCTPPAIDNDLCATSVTATNEDYVNVDLESTKSSYIECAIKGLPTLDPVETELNVSQCLPADTVLMATEGLDLTTDKQCKECVMPIPLTDAMASVEHVEEVVRTIGDELNYFPNSNIDSEHVEDITISGNVCTTGDKTCVDNVTIIDAKNPVTVTSNAVQDATTEAVEILLIMAGVEGQQCHGTNSVESCSTELAHCGANDEAMKPLESLDNAVESASELITETCSTSSIAGIAAEFDYIPEDAVPQSMVTSSGDNSHGFDSTVTNNNSSIRMSEPNVLEDMKEETFSKNNHEDIVDQETICNSVHDDEVGKELCEHRSTSLYHGSNDALGLSPLNHLGMTRPEGFPDIKEISSLMDNGLDEQVEGNIAQDIGFSASSEHSSGMDCVVSLKRQSSFLTPADDSASVEPSAPPQKRIRAMLRPRQRTAFDVVEQHQPWCPWVLVEGQDELCDKPWQRLLKNLSKGSKVRSRSDEVNPSMKALESIRNLFNGWKSSDYTD